MCFASQDDIRNSKIRAIISKNCQPIARHGSLVYAYLKTPQDVELRLRTLNGEMLPLSGDAKKEIAQALHHEFADQKDAINYFHTYAQKHKLYALSVDKTVELITNHYTTMQSPIRLHRHNTSFFCAQSENFSAPIDKDMQDFRKLCNNHLEVLDFEDDF